MKSKKCNDCDEVKTLDKFYRDKSIKDGHTGTCKKCLKPKNKKARIKYYQKNKEKIKAKIYEWRNNNPEWVKEYAKNNKERLAKHNRKWREDRYHRYWAISTISNHKGRGHIVDINPNELEQLAINTSCCSICGVTLKWHPGKGKRNNSPTLDRCSNENEMTIKNVQITCYRCNATKQDRTMKEFIDYCQMVIDKYK